MRRIGVLHTAGGIAVNPRGASCVRLGRWLLAAVALRAPAVASAQPRPLDAPWRTKMPGVPAKHDARCDFWSGIYGTL